MRAGEKWPFGQDSKGGWGVSRLAKNGPSGRTVGEDGSMRAGEKWPFGQVGRVGWGV